MATSRSAVPIISPASPLSPSSRNHSFRPISEQLPPIFLDSQPTPHLHKLFLGEGHLPASPLAWDLNEAWLGATAMARARAMRSLMEGIGYAATGRSTTKKKGPVQYDQAPSRHFRLTSYLHSVMVSIAVLASPRVGYSPSILYFDISLGLVAIVTHFLLDISSMT